MGVKRFGSSTEVQSRTIKRRVIGRVIPAKTKKPKEQFNFLTEDKAKEVKLPPKSEKLVKAVTNMNNYCIIAPANTIRQHITYDIMNDLGRIIKWRFLTAEEVGDGH